jgi:uncharacterized membrane protein YgcG
MMKRRHGGSRCWEVAQAAAAAPPAPAATTLGRASAAETSPPSGWMQRVGARLHRRHLAPAPYASSARPPCRRCCMWLPRACARSRARSLANCAVPCLMHRGACWAGRRGTWPGGEGRGAGGRAGAGGGGGGGRGCGGERGFACWPASAQRSAPTSAQLAEAAHGGIQPDCWLSCMTCL